MVYLVERTAYETPLTRRVYRFEDATMFDWFQRIWQTSDVEREDEHLKKFEQEFSCGMYSFLEDMFARGSAPETPAELTEWLNGRSFGEGTVEAIEHAFQAYDNDDEYDSTTLVFDDHFREQNPDRVEFLLRDTWELPVDCLAPDEVSKPFHWEGTLNTLAPTDWTGGDPASSTYICLVVIDDGAWLIDLLGPYEFKGVRLPQLVDFLSDVPNQVIEDSQNIDRWFAPEKWRPELIQLRSLAIDDFDQSIEQLLMSYDRIAKQEFEEKHERAKKLEKRPSHWTHQRLPVRFQVSQRMAQAAFTILATPRSGKPHETTVRWFMFDDVWAASHPALAKSLLWFAKKDTLLF